MPTFSVPAALSASQRSAGAHPHPLRSNDPSADPTETSENVRSRDGGRAESLSFFRGVLIAALLVIPVWGGVIAVVALALSR
ncbi:hypothetical protein SAMN04487788_2585 [Microbacterium testaceum StLB037]|uniref:Uncharacterized protein n=1 Tax=Microbacterium testaceum (strain StLB037) TaxID=979556 RepID=A0A1H0QV94_MICTS|nr:hypothetical protein [Microbacterium testaceum]SDP21194.1 hypothetical protein SAMN04487788_2585 [Microbacterium testaceum StLB037]